MRIWLDDDRNPMQQFIQHYFGATSEDVWMKTADEVISALENPDIDVEFISFDHDLGTEKTGYDVAKYIEEKAYFGDLPKINWRVHSANSVGSTRIKKAMENADKYWENFCQGCGMQKHVCLCSHED